VGNGASFTLVMPATPTVCGFFNLLTYSGQIQVGKLAANAPGSFLFDVERLDDPSFNVSTTVVAPSGVPTYAAPFTQMPWGTYRIVETAGDPGAWIVTRVQCFDQPVPPLGQPETPPFLDVTLPASPHVDVTLSAARPLARCLFTNQQTDITQLPPNPVPATSVWGLALLGIALTLAGIRALRRA
jgi:hypothetical protein